MANGLRIDKVSRSLQYADQKLLTKKLIVIFCSARNRTLVRFQFFYASLGYLEIFTQQHTSGLQFEFRIVQSVIIDGKGYQSIRRRFSAHAQQNM